MRAMEGVRSIIVFDGESKGGMDRCTNGWVVQAWIHRWTGRWIILPYFLKCIYIYSYTYIYIYTRAFITYIYLWASIRMYTLCNDVYHCTGENNRPIGKYLTLFHEMFRTLGNTAGVGIGSGIRNRNVVPQGMYFRRAFWVFTLDFQRWQFLNQSFLRKIVEILTVVLNFWYFVTELWVYSRLKIILQSVTRVKVCEVLINSSSPVSFD